MEKVSIERIQAASKMSEQAYGEPLICTYSGGKDSEVMLDLFLKSGIEFEVMHNHTTADAPETVYHIRKRFRELELKGIKATINPPRYKGEPTSMWKLIPIVGMPPTRLMRYCCDYLKERGGQNRFIATGVRWDESVRRTSRGLYETQDTKEKRVRLFNDNDDKRLLFENCRLKAKRIVNPIIDWADKDIWDYCQDLDLNPLYREGWARVGCIGCPMAGTQGRQRAFARYPKYEQMYIRAFGRMLEARKARGLTGKWKTAEDVFHWWMEDGVLPGQIEMNFEELEYETDRC